MASSAPAGRRWRRLMVVAATLVAAVLVLRGKLPQPADVVIAVRSADPPWLVVALLAEGVSPRMFARQQMWLLRGFGVSIAIWRALAVTYGRSAISITVLRQVPVTPGMGVIEAIPLTSLLAAGPVRPATAAVLGYRLFSCWLIIPVGRFSWTLPRRWTRRGATPWTPR